MRRSDFVSRDGAGYQLQMDRWSQRLAVLFADFAGHTGGERILDMGCGTGSLTAEITRRDSAIQVIGLDYSDVYASYAALHNGPGAQFLVADGAALPFADDMFDRSFSPLVLHFVPEPDRAIGELCRVTRPGGVVAAAVWDAGGGVLINRLFCDTAAALDSRGEDFRQVAFSRPMTRAGQLTQAWRRAHLIDVEETTLTIRMEFDNFEDYWAPYLGGDGPYAAYLAGDTDGPRSFTASAWAARGHVPTHDR